MLPISKVRSELIKRVLGRHLDIICSKSKTRSQCLDECEKSDFWGKWAPDTRRKSGCGVRTLAWLYRCLISLPCIIKSPLYRFRCGVTQLLRLLLSRRPRLALRCSPFFFEPVVDLLTLDLILDRAAVARSFGAEAALGHWRICLVGGV